MTKTYINIDGDVREASSLKIPADRTFRSAWQYNENVIEINMTKAKEIHRDNLRLERQPRLETLDVDYMKALEAGSGADAIAAKKKTLRDIIADARIDNAADADALKALDLATLLGE